MKVTKNPNSFIEIAKIKERKKMIQCQE